MTALPAACADDAAKQTSDPKGVHSSGERLVAKQLARARTPDGGVDLGSMAQLVAAAYDDAERDRKRTDRSIALMVDELESLNAGLEQTVAERTIALTTAEARYRNLIENAVVGVYRSSPDGRLLFANPAFVRMNGFDTEQELLSLAGDLGSQWYVEPRRRAEFAAMIAKHGRVEDFVSEVHRHKSRERIWVSETAWLVRDEAGAPLHYEGTVIEATDRILAEKRMTHMALHDGLTKLENRTGFRERIEKLWAKGTASGELGLICFDLDRFKDVNDTMGHLAGDTILITVAERLSALVGPGQSVARLGGDEFAVLAADVGDPAELHALAETAIARLTEPVIIAGQAVVIGATAGIAVRDAHATSADELLQNADIALYRAKSAGKGLACFYEPAMGEALRLRRQMEIDLRGAIANNELALHYQPVVTASCGKIVACEALLRWRHGERNIGPAEFIPIAEETGLMIPIGEWVIREACMEAARWPSEIGIAVNLSPVQFRSPGLLPAVIQALANSGLDPARLELEITETVMMADDRITWLTLNGLRQLGVRIALDDFGVGHSSLSYLHRFRFDKIKIDRSFVSSIESDPVNGAIVRAVIRLGAELGISIVAEGVETQEQATVLRTESCQLFQGYLFGRPGEAAGLAFQRADWSFKRKAVTLGRITDKAHCTAAQTAAQDDAADGEHITPEQVISEFDLVSEPRRAARRR